MEAANTVEDRDLPNHLKRMSMQSKKTAPATKLVHEWKLSTSATLGSAVRAKGILLEVRARLPSDAKKLVDVETGALVLRVPQILDDSYEAVAAIVTRALNGIESLPVIPREAEDILSISSAERHRWLKDGRMKSAGTRTVKLRGRARKITFHVFDPRHIEDILDRNLPDVWREDDARAAAENRRRAAGKAALARAANKPRKGSPKATALKPHSSDAKLEGWEEFLVEGLLR